MKKKFFIPLLAYAFFMGLFPHNGRAQGNGDSDKSGQAVVISPAIFYTSSSVHRGALIWPEGRIMAGAGITLFNSVSIGAEGLSVFSKMGEWLTLRTGLLYYDDNGPSDYSYQLKKRDRDFRNLRKGTIEWYGKAEMGVKGVFSYSLSFHKDLKVHYGHYFYQSLNLPLPFFPLFSLTGGLGMGDQKHNRYVFGEGAVSGQTHYDLGAGLMLPFLPWGGMFRIGYSNSYVVHVENKYASYVRPDDDLSRWSVMAMWKI